MNKNNFFNFTQRNNWDIGWPCSVRHFTIGIVGVIALILLLTFNSCSVTTDGPLDKINTNKGSIVIKIDSSDGFNHLKTIYLKDSTGAYKYIKVYNEVAELFSVGDTL